MPLLHKMARKAADEHTSTMDSEKCKIIRKILTDYYFLSEYKKHWSAAHND
jgi:hypothetical protein